MTEASESTWMCVCAADEIQPGEALVVPVTPPIAIFNLSGDFYAIDDTCSHAESSLAEGYVDGDTVECVLHFAQFNIRTGAALTPPAFCPVRTYEVTVSDGQVFVNYPGSPTDGDSPRPGEVANDAG